MIEEPCGDTSRCTSRIERRDDRRLRRRYVAFREHRDRAFRDRGFDKVVPVVRSAARRDEQISGSNSP